MTKEKSIYIQMLFQEDDRSDSKVLCYIFIYSTIAP